MNDYLNLDELVIFNKPAFLIAVEVKTFTKN